MPSAPVTGIQGVALVTIPELLTAAIGQRLLWRPDPLWPDGTGTVIGRDETGPIIRWDDGQECVASLDDNDLDAFAEQLEYLDKTTRPRVTALADRPETPPASAAATSVTRLRR